MNQIKMTQSNLSQFATILPAMKPPTTLKRHASEKQDFFCVQATIIVYLPMNMPATAPNARVLKNGIPLKP
jgi:hypothetical protein